jgi:hypothetical protein
MNCGFSRCFRTEQRISAAAAADKAAVFCLPFGVAEAEAAL